VGELRPYFRGNESEALLPEPLAVTRTMDGLTVPAPDTVLRADGG